MWLAAVTMTTGKHPACKANSSFSRLRRLQRQIAFRKADHGVGDLLGHLLGVFDGCYSDELHDSGPKGDEGLQHPLQTEKQKGAADEGELNNHNLHQDQGFG